MSFNAGGTNVGGVQAREQGELKIIKSTTTFTDSGYKTISLTCPSGKTWTLKGATQTSNSFSGTVSGSWLLIGINTLTMILYTGGAAGVNFLATTPITLKEGDTVQFQYNLSAYTSGQYYTNILIQEMDI